LTVRQYSDIITIDPSSSHLSNY